MRSAAATFDDDFDLPRGAPRRQSSRKTAGKAPGARSKGGKTARRFGTRMGKVARYAAMAMSATFVVAIIANALIEQKGRHPAPLFGKAIVLGNAQPAHAPSVAAPGGVASGSPSMSRAAAVVVPPVAQPAARPTSGHQGAVPRASVAVRAEGDDPIGRLLAGGAASPAGAKKTKRHAASTAQRTAGR